MTQDPQPASRGVCFCAGGALLALWNGGLIWLAEYSVEEYNRCVADGGIVCLDHFSGPIFVAMFAVDALVAVRFVRWLHARRTGRAE